MTSKKQFKIMANDYLDIAIPEIKSELAIYGLAWNAQTEKIVYVAWLVFFRVSAELIHKHLKDVGG